MRSKSQRDVGDDLTLSVHPSVVFRLGEEMIQDDVQAIVELAKNAYDADSAAIRLTVDTQALTMPDGTEVDDATVKPKSGMLRGTIQAIDRGTGMTRDEIVHSWLTVSGSQKRELKKSGKTTAKNRTPVGDKGLGRLGTQRLGTTLDMYTVVKGSGTAHRLTIPWDQYESAERLDSVKFALVAEPAEPSAHGTTLTIRGLKSLDHWRGSSVRDLERRLSSMISPFGNRGFKVSLNVDGQPIDLLERPEAVRANAMVRYKFDYTKRVLSVSGTVAKDYFRPDRGGADKRATYERAIAEDNGEAFFRWLVRKKKDQVESLGVRRDPERYLAFAGRFSLADIDGIPESGGKRVDPGPFSGEVDVVRLREDVPSVFDSSKEYSEFIKEINGIRIYRDGFGIPVAKDWLDLAGRWTSGSSYYTLRPENIMGFIDLSAANNPGLEETSSREQFRDTAAYRSFMGIMERWRKFTENAQTLLRRSYNEYLVELAASDAGAEVESTPTALIQRAEHQASQTADLLAALSAARQATESVLTSTEQGRRMRGQNLLSAEQQELRATPDQIRQVLSSIDQLQARVEEIRGSYAQQRDALVALREQFDAVQTQLSEAWETIALGLTAEAVTHEVGHVTDRLRQRTQTLLRRLKSPVSEVMVRTYAEQVLSSTTALTRQLAHINPALRYRRENRQAVTMSVAVRDIADYFNARWQDLGYDLDASVTIKRDFTVHINPGRLTQVLDNLILNSEYWIVSASQSPTGSVFLTVDWPTLSVSDDGPGVDPNLEGLIFEPFVSGKRKDGRGLGLFVVRQLLEPEKATVELSPERDAGGRRREFCIEFDRVTTEERL